MQRARSGSLLLALVAGCCGVALAAEPNLQELQRRLDLAKRQRAASAAAAVAASAAAQASERRAAAPAILVVRSDAPCQLSVDDHFLATLSADAPRTFQLPKGNVLIECQAAERDARYAATHALEPNVRRVVQIELREQILALQRRREAPVQPPATSRVDEKRAVPTAPTPGGEVAAAWPRIRALLEARRGRQSLRESLAVLLDASDPAESETIARFDSLLRRLPYSSALAMGSRDGLIGYGVATRRPNPQAAAEQALDSCRQRAAACVVVMTNGSLHEGAIETVSRQLGGRNPQAVREAALRAFRQTISSGY